MILDWNPEYFFEDRHPEKVVRLMSKQRTGSTEGIGLRGMQGGGDQRRKEEMREAAFNYGHNINQKKKSVILANKPYDSQLKIFF